MARTEQPLMSDQQWSRTAPAAAEDASASIRCEEGLIARWYEFQSLLFTRNRLWADLQTQRRRLALPSLRVEPRSRPMYSFQVSRRGVRRLVRRPYIAGGAGHTTLRCWTDGTPEATVLHADGEVDLSTAPHLAAAIRDAFAGHKRVIVDLSDLDYLDVSGVHVLERAAVRYDGCFVVVGSKPAVRRVFHVLDLADVLPVLPSVEAAREYLRRLAE